MADTSKNLKPFKKNPRTSEEQVEFAKKGGVASGVARRERRLLKDIAKELMDMKANDKYKNILKTSFPDVDLNEITNADVMVARQIEKAIVKNDTKAYEALQATMGEKPTDKVDHSSDGSFAQQVALTDEEKDDFSNRVAKRISKGAVKSGH